MIKGSVNEAIPVFLKSGLRRVAFRQGMAEEPAAPPALSPDIWRREAMAAGERLLDALKIEGELYVLMSCRDQMIECRRTVEVLAEDYATAVSLWRKAVEAAIEARQDEGSESIRSRFRISESA